ncbi:hypothetical protein TWF281_006870 [Arthrobotrys megalospora]
MKILSLPTEIHIQILQYLSWLDHFTLSTVSPLFTAILQHNSFRRKRYCEEIWDNNKDTHVLHINFRRFLPDETRYWRDGPGWRAEIGLHGLLASGRLILKLERGGKRTNILVLRQLDENRELEKYPEQSDPMMESLRTLWGKLIMVDISLDLLAEDFQYLRGEELNHEASFQRNRPGKEDSVEVISTRTDCAHIGTADFIKSGDQGDAIEQALRTGKLSVFDLLGKYPQIIRIPGSIYVTDGKDYIPYDPTGADRHWSIYVPWNGPGSSVKEVVDRVATALTTEIVEKNDEILGCWARFRQFRFFPRPDNIDRVHPRWKIFLDLMVVKDPLV